MTIATLNIDWGKRYKGNSDNHVQKIEETLTNLNVDIIIITESVNLKLSIYEYVYKSVLVPNFHEDVDYRSYLKGTSAYRVTIYSKYKSMNSFKVSDSYTSVCEQFDTPCGIMTLYATIIGTRFNRKPYVNNELQNCIYDCERIYNKTKTLCLVGDLNTSFIDSEKIYQINSDVTKRFKDLCLKCELNLTTANIPINIDHIFLSQQITAEYYTNSEVFVQKGILSDHQGVVVHCNGK